MPNKSHFFLFILLSISLSVQAQLFPVRVNQQWGLVDNQGKMVVKTDFDHIGTLQQQHYYLVEQAGYLGALDTAGTLTLPCEYQNLMYLGQNLFAARKAATWQVINETGRVLFDSLEASIELLNFGFFSYQYEEGLGLAHCETGKVLPPIYAGFRVVNNRWIEVLDTNKGRQWVNKNGQFALPHPMEQIEQENGLFLTQRNGKWGLYDDNGHCLVPNQWDQYQYHGLGIYEWRKGALRQLYVVETDELLETTFADIRLYNAEFLQVYFYGGDVGLMNNLGQLLFRVKAEELTDLGQGFFRYKIDNSYGIVSVKDSFHIAPKYQYIGRFEENVALVCRDSKCGIINQKGKEVLPLIYEESFSVRDNQARYRPKGKPLQLFEFDENGELEGRQQFAKIRSLKVGGARTATTSRNRSAMDTYPINDTLSWVFHETVARWGMMNTKTNVYKYTPQWANVYILPEQGLSIVAETKLNSGGKQDIGRINLIFNQRLGIFNNEVGLPVTKMEFLDIRLSDFTEDSLPVARCVFIGGKHGLINTRGRVIARNYVYIGTFANGKARATQKGRLKVDLQQKVTPFINSASAYYRGLLANYSFDQDDDIRFFRQFLSQGRLYCENPQWGYIDMNNALLVGFHYDHAERYHLNHAIVNKNGKYGLLDSEGLELLPPQYDGFDFLENTDSSLYLIHINQQWKGAVDTFGQLIFPTQYTQVRSYKEDRIAVQDTTGGWGFLDRKGTVVVPLIQRQVRDYKEGRAAFLKGHKWGFYDKNGQPIIAPTYLRVGDFSEGKAWVQLPRGERGYIDREGNLLFKGRYSQLKDFHQGRATMRISKKGWGVLDSEGNIVVKPKKRYKKIEAFNAYNIAKVRVGKKYRLINRAGKWVGRRNFGLIEDFSEGLAAVRLQSTTQSILFKANLNWRLIDTTGAFVGTQEFRHITAFSEGLAKFKNNKGRFGYLNQQGEIVVPATYIKASDFEAGKAVVWQAYNKTGVLDSSTQLSMPLIHDKILAYTQGLALLKKRNSGYGYIFENAKPQTPLLYRAARPFRHQVALVKPNDKWGMINSQGLTMLSDKYDAITDFEEGAATVTINKFWGIVNAQGEVLLAPIYEQIESVGNGLFRVEKANQVGYINDRGAWVWPLQ